jgi:hypothetical protein
MSFGMINVLLRGQRIRLSSFALSDPDLQPLTTALAANTPAKLVSSDLFCAA